MFYLNFCNPLECVDNHDKATGNIDKKTTFVYVWMREAVKFIIINQAITAAAMLSCMLLL